MADELRQRLLTIGEFAAATQLSPKALRLYDGERVLCPAAVGDNGYRYYRRDQIAAGRLIRTLREMDVALKAIAEIVAAPAELQSGLLCGYAQEADQRYARQKRAFQAGLALLSRTPALEPPAIGVRERPELTVAVRNVALARANLLPRLRAEHSRAAEACRACGLVALGEPFLILSALPGDDELDLELAVPVAAAAPPASGVTLRKLAARSCAVHHAACAGARLLELEPVLDAMFDWLDRRACRACEAPALALGKDAERLELTWPFEPVNAEASP